MMTNHQKSDFVSVIITTYNRADYIEQTLNSIQNQTYSNLEILVIDDGSNDEIATKVKSICSQFSKCKYYWKPNSGQPDSRNYGINLAKGTFIGFCDDDDYWVLNKLEIQLEILNTNKDFDIVTGCIAYVDKFGASLETTKCHTGYNHGYIFKELLSKNRTDAVTPLLRRNVFYKTGYFNPKFTISEDWDFWRRASYYHKFYATNQVLAYVRKHEFNMTNTAYPTVIASILMYYKVTYYLLKWGKNKFSTAEKEIIETAAYNEYQRLISNHFHSNVTKLKCVLLLFIKNPEAALKIVLSLLKKRP